MPKLGLTMTEGLLSSWSVQAGSQVEKGEIICIIETDKIANEIEADRSGTIDQILVEEGSTVPVGTVLAVWADGATSEANQAHLPPATPTQGPKVENRISAPNARAEMAPSIKATPLARRLAREASIDLASIVGSGPRGRIKASDVHLHQAQQHARPSAPPVEPARANASPQKQNGNLATRRIIARRLSQSKQTIPHFYVLATADFTELLDIRRKLNTGDRRLKASVNHFIVAATGRALHEMPEFAVIWEDENILDVGTTDVGIAVDAPSGLIVPVLREAGTAPFLRLVEDSLKLVETARTGGLKASDLAGGAISVSNVGMYGPTHLVPIINPGQTAILGVGGIKETFRPDANGQPSLRQELNLTLSADHRAVDGVLAAKFLETIVRLLENPLRIISNF